MIETRNPRVTGDPRLDDILTRLRTAVSELREFDLTSLVRLDQPSAGLVTAGALVEEARRELEVFDTGYVTALETGGEPRRHGAPSTATFLTWQLRLSPSEAKRRVRAAHACAPRTTLSGEVMPPERAHLAVARETGALSGEHTSLIIAALEKIPHATTPQQKVQAEQRLVAEAHYLAPAALAKAGQHLLDLIDSDGTLRDHRWQQSNRAAYLTVNPDGSGDLRARLTPETLELLRTVLEPLAQPIPTGPAGPDPRLPRERLHDALHDLATRVQQAGDLPATGGTPTTVVLTMDEQQYRSRTGHAVTDHGQLIPVDAALAMADEAVIYTVVRDSKDVPLRMGRTVRCATPGQTRALAARDRGCSFPGCDRPPGWTQRHHVKAWAWGGDTDLDNLTLLCGYHHRTFDELGWTCTMSDGRPWWIPPTWIDPTRTPIRNSVHDLPARDAAS